MPEERADTISNEEVTSMPAQHGIRLPSFVTPLSEQPAPPPSQTAGSDNGHHSQMANEGVARNFIALFILFCASLLGFLLAIVPAIGQEGALVVRIVSMVLIAVFLRSNMPKFYLILIMLGAGVMGLIYLLVCWNDLVRLPQPYKALGLIGGIGLGVTTMIQVIAMAWV